MGLMDERISEERVSELLERFEKGTKDGFGAVLVLYSIYKRKEASSKEIRKDFKEFFPKSLDYNYTSFYRLLAKLKDVYNLITESGKKKSKGPPRLYYSLTPLGKIILQKIFSLYINPLKKLKL
jgi:DNA-binding PadR family transcriptional regulator